MWFTNFLKHIKQKTNFKIRYEKKRKEKKRKEKKWITSRGVVSLWCIGALPFLTLTWHMVRANTYWPPINKSRGPEVRRSMRNIKGRWMCNIFVFFFFLLNQISFFSLPFLFCLLCFFFKFHLILQITNDNLFFKLLIVIIYFLNYQNNIDVSPS